MAKTDNSKMTDNQPTDEQPKRRVFAKIFVVLAVVIVFQLVLVGRTFVSELHVTKGDLYRESGSMKEARQEYENAVKASGRNYNALYLYGGSLLASGETEEAVGILDRCAAVAPHHPLALDLLAVCHMRLNNLEKAYEIADHASTVAGVWPRVLRTKGRILNQQKRHEDARTVYEKAIEAGYEPRDEMRRAIALTYVNAGRKDVALDVIETAIEDNPDEALNHLVRGQLLVHAEEWNSAGHALQRAADLLGAGSSSASETQRPQNKAQAHIGLAVVYLNQDRLVGAANEIFKAIVTVRQVDDRSSKLINEIMSRIENEKHDMLNQDVARTRFLMARTLFATGDRTQFQRAIIELRRVTEMIDVDARIRAAAHAELARVLAVQKMFARAMAEIDKAMELSPSMPNLDGLRANIRKAQIETESGSQP